MHAASYKNHVQLMKSAVIFEPVQQLKEMHNVLRFTTLVTLTTYRSILKYYRAGELDNFAQKYLKDLRESFLNMPYVSYTSHTTQLGTM